MRNLKTVLLLAFVFSMLAAPLLAIQDADEEVLKLLGLDEAIVGAIMTIFGIGLFGIISFVKGLLNKITSAWSKLAKDVLGKALALVCSAGATYYVLATAGLFNWKAFVLYGIYVFGVATGAWKGIKQLARPPA